MSKEWIFFPSSDCPICGGESEVLTESKFDFIVYNGDDARCIDCGLSGFISVEEGEFAYIIWEDEHGGC